LKVVKEKVKISVPYYIKFMNIPPSHSLPSPVGDKEKI